MKGGGRKKGFVRRSCRRGQDEVYPSRECGLFADKFDWAGIVRRAGNDASVLTRCNGSGDMVAHPGGWRG